MRLAPAVLARCDILRFSKIGRALIECCVEIVDFHQNPVRHAVVIVTAVIVRSCWKVTSEWIDPRARANLVLVTVQARRIRVGAARAKMAARAATAGITTKAASVTPQPPPPP